MSNSPANDGAPERALPIEGERVSNVVAPRAIAAALTEYWSPRVIAELDDCYVKVAKLRGSLAWHSHDEQLRPL